jgi:hypothetical protein
MTNFEKATDKFKKHNNCAIHKIAAVKYANRMDEVDSIKAKVDCHHKCRVKENREYIGDIFKMMGFCCQQALPLRGHDESESSKNRGNFLELLEYQSDFNPEFKKRNY